MEDKSFFFEFGIHRKFGAFDDSTRPTGEMIDLLLEEAPDTCRVIDDCDYTIGIINPCLGRDAERLVLVMREAPRLYYLLKRLLYAPDDKNAVDLALKIIRSIEES